MNENKNNLFTTTKKDLENDLNQLKSEREQQQEKERLKMVDFRKSVSEELEKKQQENKLEMVQLLKKESEVLENKFNNLERENKNKINENKEEIIGLVNKMKKENEEKIKAKLKTFYYWLFGISLVLFGVMLGVFFYLRSSVGS